MLVNRRFVIFVSLMLVMLSAALSVSADAPIDGRAGRAELRFLEGMIDHHQMALDMANDCLANATAEDVLTLCQNIIDAQSAEIELMQGWLLEWYNLEYSPVSMYMPEMGDMNHSDMPFTDPAMMMGMFAGLNRLEGIDYEIAWLEAMIDHHDDALHMAERILTRGEHEALLALAEAIIEAQTAEIELMETIIVELRN